MFPTGPPLLRLWLSLAALPLLGTGVSSCQCCSHQTAKELPKRERMSQEQGLQDYREVCGYPDSGKDIPWRMWQIGTQGPPVLLLCDILGTRPQCLELGRKVSRMAGGHQVYVPLLFGTFGKESSFIAGSLGAEFHGWRQVSGDADQPVLPQLENLCADLHAKTGHKVVVIGNCLSGGAAVALLRNEHVCAAAASQPALPFLLHESFDVSPRTLSRAVEQAHKDRKPALLGFNYHRDQKGTHPRFVLLKKEFCGAMRAMDLCQTDADKCQARCEGMEIIGTTDSTQHSVLIPLEDEADQGHYDEVLCALRKFLRDHRND